MKNRTKKSTYSIAAVLFALFFLFLPPCLQAEQSKTAIKELPLPLGNTEESEGYAYILEGRPDPFKPFISEKAAAAIPISIPDRILEPDRAALSGLQLFEPGQLTLVAIVVAEEYDFAMVEDTIGKGYVVRKGTKVGKRGQVTRIDSNKVIIEETAFTQTGKKLTSNVVMLLKKEGEE